MEPKELRFPGKDVNNKKQKLELSPQGVDNVDLTVDAVVP